jgi:signal transduction histidine kinase
MMNLVSISVVVIIAFTAIFAVNFARLESANRNLLDSMPSHVAFIGQDGMTGEFRIEDSPNMPIEYSRTFIADVDILSSSMYIHSSFDMPDEQYVAIVNKAMHNAKDYGKVRTDSHVWMYKYAGTRVTNDTVSTGIFRFLDVTESSDNMIQLFVVLVSVGILSLIVIYLISRRAAQRSIAPIAESMEKQRRFIADASHELKTPIAVIESNLDVVLASPELSVADQAKWLSYIKEEGTRMNKLINELLTLARAEDEANVTSISNISSKRLLLSKPLIDVEELVTGCALRMEAAMFEKNIRFSLNGLSVSSLDDEDDYEEDYEDYYDSDFDDDFNIADGDDGDANVIDANVIDSSLDSEIMDSEITMVQQTQLPAKRVTEPINTHIQARIDADKLTQVVMILLDNALKYTASGGECEVNIKVVSPPRTKGIKTSRNKDNILIEVCNSANLDYDALEHVFDRFYRSDESRTSSSNKKGYGLGLAIAKALIESEGGELQATVERKTAVFTITL